MKPLPRPPRRFRHPLLLPPGWLALGWLLLGGCLMLQAHWRQLLLPNVLQLTMVPLRQEDAKGWVGVRAKSPYGNPFDSVATWNELRPWHDAELRGSEMGDFLTTAAIEAATRAIQADSAHAGGVRVRLLPGATYASLVALLDIMNYTNQKVYWLDTRHRPTTLYALTKKELPRDPDAPTAFICGTRYYQQLPLPPGIWQQWLAALQQPAWRLPLLLLAALGSSSAYRLVLRVRSS